MPQRAVAQEAKAKIESLTNVFINTQKDRSNQQVKQRQQSAIPRSLLNSGMGNANTFD